MRIKILLLIRQRSQNQTSSKQKTRENLRNEMQIRLNRKRQNQNFYEILENVINHHQFVKPKKILARKIHPACNEECKLKRCTVCNTRAVKSGPIYIHTNYMRLIQTT